MLENSFERIVTDLLEYLDVTRPTDFVSTNLFGFTESDFSA